MNEHCELCDMSLAYCPHGQPAPPPQPTPPPKVATPRVRKAAAPRTKAPSAPTVTSRPVQRRWTPPQVLETVILDVLTEAGGALEGDAALAAIEAAMDDRFEPGDSERTPTGELRWHLAARKARQQLIREGQMTKEQPGVWTLAAR